MITSIHRSQLIHSAVRRSRAGASRTRQAASQSRLMPLVLRVSKYAGMLSALVAIIFLWLNFDPQKKWQEYTHRPIKELRLEGSFKYLSSQALQNIVESHMKDSFLELDLFELKQKIELNPWVDTVNILRKWPDQLIVQVVEQHPIAFWGEKSFLNSRGDIVTVQNTSKIDTLPSLRGEDKYAREIMDQYLRLGKLLSQHQLTLSGVEMDPMQAWTLRLNSGMTIKLGRDRIWEKLQYLLVAKDGELGAKFNQIQQIDMRYPSGFAVTWKDMASQSAVAGG